MEENGQVYWPLEETTSNEDFERYYKAAKEQNEADVRKILERESKDENH